MPQIIALILDCSLSARYDIGYLNRNISETSNPSKGASSSRARLFPLGRDCRRLSSSGHATPPPSGAQRRSRSPVASGCDQVQSDILGIEARENMTLTYLRDAHNILPPACCFKVPAQKHDTKEWRSAMVSWSQASNSQREKANTQVGLRDRSIDRKPWSLRDNFRCDGRTPFLFLENAFIWSCEFYAQMPSGHWKKGHSFLVG